MYERACDIREMISAGVPKETIWQEVAHKWKVAPATIESHYYKLISEMSAMVEEAKVELRAVLLARQEHIYQRSLQEGQYKTALAATEAQAKLAGLNEKKEAESRQPEMITVSERDYSRPVLVGEVAENE